MSRGAVARLLAAARRGLQRLPLATWSSVSAGFIVSTGRTGTLRLAQVLDRATDGVVSVHEPSPDLFDLGEAVARGEIPTRRAARMLRRLRQPMCNRVRRQGGAAYVESNNNAAYLLAVIRAVFDEPRFVHVVRDGRATVRSLYSNTPPSRRPGHDRAPFMDHDDSRCRLAAVDFPDDPWADRWFELSRFERVCWYWAKKNALIREELADAPDAILVRFEDVFEVADHPGFREIVEFLGLEPRLARSSPEIHELLSERSNRARRYLVPPPDDWPSDLAASFDRIAGDEQRRYYI